MSPTTLAATQASANLAANRGALAKTQADLPIGDAPADVEWIFGRDRALTGRDAEGHWFTGCSLPRRAAVEMMRQLEIAERLDDLRVPPGNRLEALKGDRGGQHSIRVNDQFRVCFRWTDAGVEDVEIVDYH